MLSFYWLLGYLDIFHPNYLTSILSLYTNTIYINFIPKFIILYYVRRYLLYLIWNIKYSICDMMFNNSFFSFSFNYLKIS